MPRNRMNRFQQQSRHRSNGRSNSFSQRSSFSMSPQKKKHHNGKSKFGQKAQVYHYYDDSDDDF